MLISISLATNFLIGCLSRVQRVLRVGVVYESFPASIAVSVCVVVVLLVLVAGVGFVVPVFVCLYGENLENPLLSVQQSNNNKSGNAK